MYSIEELAKASKEFGVGGALIAAALRSSGKTHFTLAEAKIIVANFRRKVVRD